MFRNQYDTDITTFSPAGRLHQVEYALEAVKQGACAVGLVSKDWALVGSLKRAASELASYQQKVFQIDSHMGIAASGLISDARVLAQYMRNECLNHRYVYAAPMPTERLVSKLSDKAQHFTQKADKRPYGVGLLVAGFDPQTGPHLFQTEPSGIYYEYKAQAIGARAQSAKTYLEKNYDSFADASLDDLVRHVLHALKGASQKKLTSRNVCVGFVGRDGEFKLLEGDAIRAHVAAVTNEDDEDEDEEEAKKKKAGAAAAEEKEEKDEAEQKAQEEEEAARQAQQAMHE